MGFAPIRTVAPEKDRPVEPKSTASADFATAALFADSHGGLLSSRPPFFFFSNTSHDPLDVVAAEFLRQLGVGWCGQRQYSTNFVDCDTIDSIIDFRRTWIAILSSSCILHLAKNGGHRKSDREDQGARRAP